MFTWLNCRSLDCDQKKWRLFADVVNDLAVMIDLISPAYKEYFIFFAAFSSGLRAIVGVAGGATRTALRQHQAISHNAADVTAKDGSQETVVNLGGMVAGSILLSQVSGNFFLIWFLFLLSTAFHIYSNYKAVRSLQLDTFNMNRLYTALAHYIVEGDVISPKEANLLEPIFGKLGPRVVIAPSLNEFIKNICFLETLRSVWNKNINESFLLLMTNSSTAVVLLKDSATQHSVIEGVITAHYNLMTGDELDKAKMKDICNDFIRKAKHSGWNVDQNHFEIGDYRIIESGNLVDYS